MLVGRRPVDVWPVRFLLSEDEEGDIDQLEVSEGQKLWDVGERIRKEQARP